MIDFTLVIDSALTSDQCDHLIESALARGLSTTHLETHRGYRHTDFMEDDGILGRLHHECMSAYNSRYPSLDYLDDQLEFSPWRFKHFPPTYSYNQWHSEHNLIVAHRVLCVIVYLSDHACGTEFLHTGDVVESRKGRALVFPTFWTHTHRGGVCPDHRDRYIMSSYAHYARPKLEVKPLVL